MSKLVSAIRLEKGVLEKVLSDAYEVFNGSEIYDIELHESDVLFKVKVDESQLPDSPTYEELMTIYEETSKELNKMRLNLKTVSQDYNKLISDYAISNYQLHNLQKLIKGKDDVIDQLKSELNSYKTKTTVDSSNTGKLKVGNENVGKVELTNLVEDVKLDNEEQLKLSASDLMNELRNSIWLERIKNRGGI